MASVIILFTVNLNSWLSSLLLFTSLSFSLALSPDQRLNLAKNNLDDEDIIRGQLICESHVCPAEQLAARVIITGLGVLMG